MGTVLAVGLGGFLGALLRYWLHAAVQGPTPGVFPSGTLAVNVLGCLAAGGLLRALSERAHLDPTWRLFWMVGVLGALTTFSTLGAETFQLLRAGRPLVALGSVGANVLLGLGAVALGWSAVGRLA